MKKTQTIELLKGTFSPLDAQEILLQLLDSKINFHNLKNWSSRERLGKPDAFSEQRLNDLKESRKKVQMLVSESISEEKNITLNSSIEINIE